MNNHAIIFELLNWRVRNKAFSLRIKFQCNDYVGWHDYYTVQFICNGKVKNQDNFRRFIDNQDFYPFCRFLENHNLARATLNSFHYYKMDILSLKVIQII
jgi:hypothetical protein